MPIVDRFHINEDLVLIMPCADYSLAEHLAGKGPLRQGAARQLLLDSVAGLGELLEQGVIHRDIKPANILWWRDRWVAFGRMAETPGPPRPRRSEPGAPFWSPRCPGQHDAPGGERYDGVPSRHLGQQAPPVKMSPVLVAARSRSLTVVGS